MWIYTTKNRVIMFITRYYMSIIYYRVLVSTAKDREEKKTWIWMQIRRAEIIELSPHRKYGRVPRRIVTKLNSAGEQSSLSANSWNINFAFHTAGTFHRATWIGTCAVSPSKNAFQTYRSRFHSSAFAIRNAAIFTRPAKSCAATIVIRHHARGERGRERERWFL